MADPAAAVPVAASDAEVRPPLRPWLRFTRHLAEMMLAMFFGMMVLGGAIDLALIPFGVGIGDASVAVAAGVMAFNMTVPMVAWMHFGRRMPVGRSVEMTGAMVVPTVIAVALHSAGAIDAHGVMIVQHLAMLPAMLAVMAWRHDAYTH